MKDAISFDDYESISDVLVNLGQGCSLRMNINLASSNMNTKERYPMSSEYVYRSNKYSNRDRLVSLKRKFFPYMSIDYKDDNQILGKGQIMISAYDILGFQDRVMEADKLLMDAFRVRNDKMILLSNMNFHVESFPTNGSVSFSPMLFINDDKTRDPGVKMTLNGSITIDIHIKTWKAFVYYVKTADLYGWAASVVSGYTDSSIGRFITDMRNISKDPTINDVMDEEVTIKNTKPISKEEKKRNFFDD